MEFKKVFISVGMRGRSDDEVVNDIKRAIMNIQYLYGENVIVQHITNWTTEPKPDGAIRLYYLGEAIKKLGDCDACYFVKGWKNYKGCIVENTVCQLYGIEIIEESE